MNYIINLFGTGIRYWNCELPTDVFDDMNQRIQKHNVRWEDMLFDLEILNHYGFEHWSKLSSNPANVGFLLEARNRIEIKQESKLITRFKATDFKTELTLFPLYQTVFIKESTEDKADIKSFKLIQMEKGLIGKYKFQSENFSIDQLAFTLSSIKKMQFLLQIKVEDRILVSSQEDNVITGGEVFFDKHY
jgi:hypothetical protein